MPTKINYPFPNSSGGASLEFAGPVNASQSLNTSGYYFSDNLTDNIGIDCSGLGLGGYVNWVNLSTKAIVFYGLATVNGTTIPAIKGVRIEANTAIEFFLKDANFNARVLSGSYAIDWIPGYIPPFYTFTYGSYSYTDNDIFQAIGTLNGSQAFTNPLTAGRITGSSSAIQSGYPLTLAFDRTGGESRWNNANNAENWIIIDFKTYTCKITKIVIVGTNWPTGGLNGRTIYFYGSDDGTNWTQITTWTQSAGASQSISPDFTTPQFYRYFKWYVPSGSWIQIEDFKWYGEIIGL